MDLGKRITIDEEFRHLGFDLNRSIAERPFVSCILEPGQTGVLD